MSCPHTELMQYSAGPLNSPCKLKDLRGSLEESSKNEPIWVCRISSDRD